jgi:phosphomannomutase
MIKFGTDGWRGIIGDDFTFQNVKIVAQAVADYLIKIKGKRVVIGYDTRFLSREFASAAAEVLSANKIKVDLSLCCVPSPVVSFNTFYGKYDLGIIITASHNPSQFNGLKIKTREGGAADKSLTDKIEKFLYKHKPKELLKDTLRRRFLREKDLTSAYLAFLRKFVNIKRIKALKLKILIDVMYGAAGSFAQDILSSRTIKIDYLHNEFNPSFGGIHPEPIAQNLKELIMHVKKGKYDFGVALDGDGDRIALIDKKGNFIGAQEILPLLTIHMVKDRKEAGGVGKTVVGSNLIDCVAVALGVGCFEVPVGFKYISNLFKEHLICIGGEEAGGIGFKGYIPERDGTASLLMVLEMIAYQGMAFSTLISALRKKYGRWHYMRTSLPLRRVSKNLDQLKLPSLLLGKKIERVNRMDGVKLITKNSWLMFRMSGTEPIVRVYAEAKTRHEAERLLAVGKRLVYAL